MRKPLIAANWKMNNNIFQSIQLVKKLKTSLKSAKGREVVVCPTFTSLQEVSKLLKNSNIRLGAQNMFCKEKGAFTGEISPLMLKEIGCDYVILGHSERRQQFNEDDDLINKKVIRALEHSLKPILCVGETLEERDQDKTENKIKTQLEAGLIDISEKNVIELTIAYEPIWAIGTGANATPAQAEEVHNIIRNLILNKYNKDISDKIRILYGGSVKPDNVNDLMKEEDIDGCLVGGASLDAESFTKIVNFR